MVETDFYAILDALIAAPFGRFVGGRGFCILARRSRANTRCDHSREPLKPCSPAARTRGSRRDLPDPAPSAPNGQPNLASAGRQNLVTRYGLVDLAGTVDRNPGYPELLPHSRGDGHWRGGPCPRARSRNTDCQQGSNWAAKETAPGGRSSGGRSPRRKTRGGRLDSSSLSSLFDRGARAKRVVPEIDGEGAGHLNGCNFSNLKAPTFHRRPKPKAGRYAWDSGRVK